MVITFGKRSHLSFLPCRPIREIQNDFIIFPLDKAGNNYGIICKEFYIINLMKEMGVVYMVIKQKY